MLDNIDEKRRFATLLTALSDYYKSEISKGVLKLYWEGLRQYDFESIEKAAWSHTQSPDESGRWMPRISDLTKVLQGSSSDQAALAWSKVDQAIRRVGTYADVVFDDVIIHRVIADMGGWIKFGSMNEDEWPFTGNQFRARYQGYKIRGEVPEYQPVLTGITNAHNSSEGFVTTKPVLIGNQLKAQHVMIGGANKPIIQMQMAKDAIIEPKIKKLA